MCSFPNILDWNSNSNSGDESYGSDKKKKRRSRWNTDNEEKTIIPGMPPVIPPNLSKEQEKQYISMQ